MPHPVGVSYSQNRVAYLGKEMIEKLKASGHVQQVIENINKLQNLDIDLDQLSVQRIKTANDGHFKLINKFLPDLKSIEVTDNTEDKPQLTQEQAQAQIISLLRSMKAPPVLIEAEE